LRFSQTVLLCNSIPVRYGVSKPCTSRCYRFLLNKYTMQPSIDCIEGNDSRTLSARQPRPHLSHEPSSRSPAVLHPRIFTDSLRGPNDSVYTRLLDRLPASSTLACSSSPSAHQRHRRRQKHQTRLLQFWVHAPNQITAVLSSRLAWLK
jgi:hypothetical protein